MKDVSIMKETLIIDGRRITRMDLSDLGPITEKEKEMIKEASLRPAEYDEDCPPLSPAMISEVERLIGARRA